MVYVKLAGYLVIGIKSLTNREHSEKTTSGTHIKKIFFCVFLISAMILPKRKNAIHGKNGSPPEKIKPVKNPKIFHSPIYKWVS